MAKDSIARALASGAGAVAAGAQSRVDDLTQYGRALLGRWDANDLQHLSDGAPIRVWVDASGNGNPLVPTTYTPYAKQTDTDGYPCARGDGVKRMYALNGSGFPVSSAISAPFTTVMVVRPSVVQAQVNPALIVGGFGINLDNDSTLGTTGVPIASGNSLSTGRFGPSVQDGQKHVIIVAVDAASTSIYVDGYLTSATTSGNLLAAGLSSPAVIFAGDLYEMIFSSGRMSQTSIDAVTADLAEKWGVTGVGTYAGADGSSRYESGSTSDGSTYRIWTPSQPSEVPTLVLWSHPQAQNEQISPGYFAYPYVHAAMAMGWHFAASSMGYSGSPGGSASSWGNATAQNALSLLNTLMQSREEFPNVILAGASMGGLASALAIIQGTIPNVKAAYLIDGVYSLFDMYKRGSPTDYGATIDAGYGITTGTIASAASVGATSISSSVSYVAGSILVVDPYGTNPETVTTSGAPTGSGPYTITLSTPLAYAHSSAVKISDYGTKTAGHDPMLASIANFSGLPCRFTSAPGDTTVPQSAHTIPFAARIAATAAEAGVVQHGGVHLSGGAANPKDFVEFIKRVVPGS